MPARREFIERFIPASRLVGHLGTRVGEIGVDRAELVPA
jgi:hypothetical protein